MIVFPLEVNCCHRDILWYSLPVLMVVTCCHSHAEKYSRDIRYTIISQPGEAASINAIGRLLLHMRIPSCRVLMPREPADVPCSHPLYQGGS
jgi:hypothetical protein